MNKGKKILNNYIKLVFIICITILVIITPFIAYQFIEYNRSGRADSDKYKEKANVILNDSRDKIYDGEDFEYSFNTDGNSEKIILKDGKYEVYKNDVIVDYDNGQNIIVEVTDYLPTEIFLDVSLEGDDYIASYESIYYIKDNQSFSEEIDKIIVNKDGKYVRIEDEGKEISWEFK